MTWLKWLPWRFLVRRIARAHGFLDPVALLARLECFAQPAEVAQPIELLRAGAVFHARGLINSRVIQHNLDWVWPYWIERQFDPASDAFVPRAFSITHVNLTHRNWTAVGLPDLDELPIVDPRGLLTPFYDGWSLDAWVMDEEGCRLWPSRATKARQRWDFGAGLAVITETAHDGLRLESRASVEAELGGAPVCRLNLRAAGERSGWLVLALRPYNPEGISFIHEVELTAERTAWRIEGEQVVSFSAAAQRHHVSDYRAGDVAIHLRDRDEETTGVCDVGMATAAALFRLEVGRARELDVCIALQSVAKAAAPTWEQALQGVCELRVPEDRIQFLFEAALRTLILHSPGDVYPGPYTYKRFWFRDAAFIIHALLCTGLTARAERALDRFPARQTSRGYFHSQEGEWDANGQALWIMRRFCALTGREPKLAWRQAILRGARWIGGKRLSRVRDDAVHAGLLPAGFSAEHLGPNDYYYWDDFWGVAGLHAAADLCTVMGDDASAEEFLSEAEAFQADVDRSLSRSAERLVRPAMPAAPERRLDAGAIGSLASGYPTQLHAPGDPRLLDTAAFLLERCFVGGGFFQDMIHAGINPYLTLHVAQVLLRAEDPRYLELLDTVTALASPTGQWPEAIHPRTGGGCMGDGQHVWAAAEWLMMVRHLFLREEGERLILCQGVPARWLVPGGVLRFGPAPTAFGTLTLELMPAANHVRVAWKAGWHGTAPVIDVRLPGFEPFLVAPGQTAVELQRDKG